MKEPHNPLVPWTREEVNTYLRNERAIALLRAKEREQQHHAANIIRERMPHLIEPEGETTDD